MSFINKNKKAFIGALALAFVVIVGGAAAAARPKTVEMIIDGNSITKETSSKTVKELLLEQNFKLEEVKVLENLDSRISNTQKINISTLKDINFKNKDVDTTVKTYALTVKDFLQENNITTDKNDIVSPSLDSYLTKNSKVSFDDIDLKDYKTEKEIPFNKKTEYTFNLEFGKSQVKTKGVKGIKEVLNTKLFKNGNLISDTVKSETIINNPIDEVTLIGTKEVVKETIKREIEKIYSDSLYTDESRIVEEGNDGEDEVVYENNGKERKEVSRKTLVKPSKQVIEEGTKERPSALYSLGDLQFHGVINWGGYRFTYYSQQVLPGGGLNIPGRHVNAGGFVSDGDGYIVVANDAPIGTVISTPFGYPGKVYDRGTYGNHIDVYTQ